MTYEFKQTPTTPAWMCELASTHEPLPAAAWRIMTWFAAELLAHNARTGYTRKRFGHGLAAEVGRCSPRTAQRALSALASIGIIDRVEEDSQSPFGALTGIPSLRLKRNNGGTSFRGIGRPTPPAMPVSVQPRDEYLQLETKSEPSNVDREVLAAEWATISSRISAQIDSDSFECYIAPLMVLPADDGSFLLSAPNDLVQEQAQRILDASECCHGAAPKVIVGRPAHTSTRSIPCSQSPTLSRQVPQPRRPITAKTCRKVVSELQEHFYVMALRGRRPTEKFKVLYAWIVFHATYGSGSEDPKFSVNQAISGAFSLLRAGRFSMPAGFQPELVQRYVDCVTNEIEGAAEQDCYVSDDPGLRHACHLIAA